MRVCVVGLGKIGLPLAVQAAQHAHQVTGVDRNPQVVADVNAGRPPFPGEPTLDEALADVVADGRLTATTDTGDAVGRSEVVLVIVPLAIDAERRPDFTAMDAATAAVGPALAAGTLVSYETTLPVGSTRRRFAPALAAASGLTPGENLFVVHSPERVSSGTVFRDLRRYPKLVGGVDAESTRRGTDFYASFLDFDERADLPRPNGVWPMDSAEAAELTKLAETTYRDVNIALANEFARFAASAGIDFAQVAEAANSQPYSHLHRPGIAVGGHCIPVYPWLYLAGDPGARLPPTARAVNEAMPGYAVDLLAELLGDLAGLRVAVLGAAYRGGVRETAFSGVFPVVAALAARGAVPLVHDPLYGDDELATLGLTAYQLGQPVDALVVQTDHAEYRDLSPADTPGVRAVVDGRGVLDRARWAGVPLAVIGR